MCQLFCSLQVVRSWLRRGLQEVRGAEWRGDVPSFARLTLIQIVSFNRLQGKDKPVQPHLSHQDRWREQQGGDRVLPGQAHRLRVQGKDSQAGHTLPLHLGSGT